MKEYVQHIIQFLEFETGENLMCLQDVFLESTIDKMLESNDGIEAMAYLAKLKLEPAEQNLLLNTLFNSYTDFFRNKNSAYLLKNELFPALIKKKLKSGQHLLRIWSAACSSGQEVLGIAMILEGLETISQKQINYQILGTDSSALNLVKAIRGVYSMEELKQLSLNKRNKFFHNLGEEYKVSNNLLNHITYETFNLLDKDRETPEAGIFGDFDLVVCANVLMYYNDDCRSRMFNKLWNAIHTDGFLMVGDAERAMVPDNLFEELLGYSCIYRKICSDEND